MLQSKVSSSSLSHNLKVNKTKKKGCNLAFLSFFFSNTFSIRTEKRRNWQYYNIYFLLSPTDNAHFTENIFTNKWLECPHINDGECSHNLQQHEATAFPHVPTSLGIVCDVWPWVPCKLRQSSTISFHVITAVENPGLSRTQGMI